MVRWVSADLQLFAVFCRFLIGFCGILIGNFARYLSMPSQWLYSYDFFLAPLA